MHTVI